MAAVPSIGRASRVERRAAPAVDEAAQLYERYSVQIFGYCLHQLGSREEAEDAVQTTFMNAFRGLARGIVPDVEQAWLFKIAHNVCLSRRRSSWRRGRVEAPNNMEVLQEVVPAKEKVADELIRLQDVLEDMPESQRRAILLREWQGLSYREIADELELSQAAVETLIFRARRALAAGLEEAPADGSWRRRIRRGADVGGVVAFVKTLLGGGGAAAVKVAAVVTLAGAAVATTAAEHMRSEHRPAVSPEASRRAVAAAPPARAPRSSSRVASHHATVTARPKKSRVRRPDRGRERPAASRTRHATAPLASHEASGQAERATEAPEPVAAPPEDETAPKAPPTKAADPAGHDGGHAGSAPAQAPAPAPASPSGSAKPNPGKGHTKNQPVEEQPEPQEETQPAPPAEDEAPSGNAQAPGQQDKGEKENKGGNGGNGGGGNGGGNDGK